MGLNCLNPHKSAKADFGKPMVSWENAHGKTVLPRRIGIKPHGKMY
jgi:hypothetical protein